MFAASFDPLKLIDALSTLNAQFVAMQARVSASLERLASDRLERQRATVKRGRIAARRQAAGAVPVLYRLPAPAAPLPPSAWERAQIHVEPQSEKAA